MCFNHCKEYYATTEKNTHSEKYMKRMYSEKWSQNIYDQSFIGKKKHIPRQNRKATCQNINNIANQ